MQKRRTKRIIISKNNECRMSLCFSESDRSNLQEISDAIGVSMSSIVRMWVRADGARWVAMIRKGLLHELYLEHRDKINDILAKNLDTPYGIVS